jgi:hypothetical protein
LWVIPAACVAIALFGKLFGLLVIGFFASALRAHVGHEIAYPSLIPFSVT